MAGPTLVRLDHCGQAAAARRPKANRENRLVRASCRAPLEAHVASLSGCHMLTFLAICARKRLVVDRYDDEASGSLEKTEGGKLWMTRVVLRPRVRFGDGTAVADSQLMALHHQAHA